MRKDRAKAVVLRQRGKSYNEIRRLLAIPKSTLSLWFKNQPWSILVRDTLGSSSSVRVRERVQKMARASQKYREDQHQRWQTEAKKEFTALIRSPLFLPFLLFYWSRGDLNPRRAMVRFSSSDPAMIKIFHQVLIKTIKFPEKKIIIRLYLYPDLLGDVQRNLWSQLTGLDPIRFKKPSVLKRRPGTKRHSYGLCLIQINSRLLKDKLLVWLEMVKASFSQTTS